MLPLPEKTDGDINYAVLQANNSVPAVYISALNSPILRREKAIVRVNMTMNIVSLYNLTPRLRKVILVRDVRGVS